MSYRDKEKIESVEIITKKLNKKGKLKGKNKKETKMLKAVCPHHHYNKKHKLIPDIRNDGHGHCICLKCGAVFKAGWYDNDELHALTDDAKEFLNAGKFASVATHAGSKAVDVFTKATVAMEESAKVYKKIRKIGKKSESIHKKKKKNNYGGGQYGSWSVH